MGRKLPFTSLFSRAASSNGDHPTTTTATKPPPSSSSNSFSNSSYNYSPPSSSWAWPSCKHPRTDSFRATRGSGSEDHQVIYKTVNSVFFDSAESCSFTHSSDHSESFSTASDDFVDSGAAVDSVETVIRGVVKSDRLFFDRGGDTSSILEEAKTSSSELGVPSFKESIMMAMESEDPYRDFRTSMEEMVEAHGMKDWKFLEELLVWYLRVNGKKTHGFIVGAFVDLLVGLAATPPDPHHHHHHHHNVDDDDDDRSHDVTSPSFSSSLLSSSLEIEEVEEGTSGSC